MSYNWYMTMEVMVLVPRSKESSGVVSVNALGKSFCYTFLCVCLCVRLSI